MSEGEWGKGMNGSLLPLEAYLVLDNSLLSMLTEFHCETRTKTLAPALIIPTLRKSIRSQFDILKKYTPDNCLYCSELVATEYKPWNGKRLSQTRYIPPLVKRKLAGQVTRDLSIMAINPQDIESLRCLPDAPIAFAGFNYLLNFSERVCLESMS